MEISPNELSSRLEMAEEKVDKLEDRSVKICQSNGGYKKMNRASVANGKVLSHLT